MTNVPLCYRPLFVLFRLSHMGKRKPYGNVLLEDVMSVYMALRYFGLTASILEGKLTLVLLVDGLVDGQELAWLEFLTERRYIWPRFEVVQERPSQEQDTVQEGDGGDGGGRIITGTGRVKIISTSWGELLRRKMEAGLMGAGQVPSADEVQQLIAMQRRIYGEKRREREAKLAEGGSLAKPLPKKLHAEEPEPLVDDLPQMCVPNLLVGFAAAGYANADEIHNHLTTNYYEEIYSGDVGMALSLGLDRGGTSVPDLVGFSRWLYERSRRLSAAEGSSIGAGMNAGGGGGTPTTTYPLGGGLPLHGAGTAMQESRRRVILVSLPCCLSSYLAGADADAEQEEQTSSELDGSRVVVQKLPRADAHRRLILDESLGRFVTPLDDVLTRNPLPGNEPTKTCTRFSFNNTPLIAALKRLVSSLNLENTDESTVIRDAERFELRFVSSCAFLPQYFQRRQSSISSKVGGSLGGNPSTSSGGEGGPPPTGGSPPTAEGGFRRHVLNIMQDVSILLTLAGFDAFEHDSFVTQALLLKRSVATIIAPYRSMAPSEIDAERIDESADRLFNMESVAPRHTRTLPIGWGPLFQLRRMFRHRPYVDVQEVPLMVAGVGRRRSRSLGAGAAEHARPEGVGTGDVTLKFSPNVTDHRAFLRRELLKYMGRGLTPKEKGPAGAALPRRRQRDDALLGTTAHPDTSAPDSHFLSSFPKSSSGTTSEFIATGVGGPTTDPGGDELLTPLRNISPLSAAERNPTRSLALSFCDRDVESLPARNNIGEYCYTQIWSSTGCSNLPMSYGGPQVLCYVAFIVIVDLM